MPPATRVGDVHVCPIHTGGPVNAPGSSTVNIGGQPAARAGDRAACAGPDDTIVQGSPTVFIDGRPAARAGDKSAHGGMVVSGCPTVNIGNEGGGGGTSGGPARSDREDPAPSGPGDSGQSGGGEAMPDDSAPPPGRRAPAPTDERAVPRAADAPPKPPSQSSGSKTTKKDKEEKSASKPPSGDRARLESPTLLGSPATNALVQSLLDLTRKLYPQFDQQLSRYDPQSLEATSVQLKDAIARKDVETVNGIGSRLVELIQSGGKLPPAGGGAGGIQRPIPRPGDRN
jgi:uncharacterized Zn-binding protein involved in type VI secretion